MHKVDWAQNEIWWTIFHDVDGIVWAINRGTENQLFMVWLCVRVPLLPLLLLHTHTHTYRPTYSQQAEPCCRLQRPGPWDTGDSVFPSRGTDRNVQDIWWSEFQIIYCILTWILPGHSASFGLETILPVGKFPLLVRSERRMLIVLRLVVTNFLQRLSL